MREVPRVGAGRIGQRWATVALPGCQTLEVQFCEAARAARAFPTRPRSGETDPLLGVG